MHDSSTGVAKMMVIMMMKTMVVLWFTGDSDSGDGEDDGVIPYI